MRDDPGQTGIPGHLFVEVNRHRVAGRGRVPESLVVVDVLHDLGHRSLFAELVIEFVLGAQVTDRLVDGHAPDKRRDVLLVDQFAVLGATFQQDRGTRAFLEPALAEAGLPAELADALDDTSFDAEIRRETDEAFPLTGKDVGTPIIQFQPPAGVAFFGPVISRLPSETEAGPLWDNVLGLASFPGFAELKRSLR